MSCKHYKNKDSDWGRRMYPYMYIIKQPDLQKKCLPLMIPFKKM